MKRKFFIRHFRAFLIPVILLFLLFGIPSICIAWNYSTKEIRTSSQELLALACSNLEQILDESTLLRYSLEENVKVRVALKDFFNTEEITYEKQNTFYTVMNTINTPVNVRKHIHSIYLYLDNPAGNVLVSGQGLMRLSRLYDTEWYTSYQKQSPEVDMWTEHRQVVSPLEGQPEEMVTLYMRFKHMNGVIVLNVRGTALADMVGEAKPGNDRQLLVVSDQGELMFTNRIKKDDISLEPLLETGQETDKVSVNGTKYIVTRWYSQLYHWNYYSLVPEPLAYQMPRNLIFVMCAVALAAVALSVTAAFFQTRNNYSHISRIIDMFEAAETGQDIPEIARNGDAYSYIAQNITRTFLMENALKVQVMDTKLSEEQAKIQALQQQLNPHFLQNTLEYIHQEILSVLDHPDHISNMILDISSILRYSMKIEEQVVPVYEEINNMRRYVRIMDARCEGHIRVDWQYSDDVLEYSVMKLILQPLVENAILHGRGTPQDVITIRIALRECDDKRLMIVVQDTGNGMSREKKKEVLENMKSPDGGGHVGLSNIYRRLALIYKEDFEFRILSRTGMGTIVKITIPLY